MTFFSMVAVALFVGAGRVWRTRRQQWRSRFFPVALTPKPATRDPLGKIPAEPVYHGDCEEKRRSRQNRRAALGKFEAEAVYHGDHALLRWRSCQNSRAAWEKSNGNPFMMAIPPRKSGAYAKTGDLRPAWENSQRNPFIMAIAEKRGVWIGETIRISKTIGYGPRRRSDRR